MHSRQSVDPLRQRVFHHFQPFQRFHIPEGTRLLPAVIQGCSQHMQGRCWRLKQRVWSAVRPLELVIHLQGQVEAALQAAKLRLGILDPKWGGSTCRQPYS
jgi:hypothetical protein